MGHAEGDDDDDDDLVDDLDFNGIAMDMGMGMEDEDLNGISTNGHTPEVWGDLDWIESRDSLLDMERDSRAAVGMVIVGVGMDFCAIREFVAEVWNLSPSPSPSPSPSSP